MDRQQIHRRPGHGSAGSFQVIQGRLKAEYTIEGMHIREEGYRAIWSLVREEVLR